MADKTHRTFGMELRAARLGYRYANRWACYVRIEIHGDYFRVELVPPGAFFSHTRAAPSVHHHLCWWDAFDGNGEDALRLSPTLDHILLVEEVRIVWLDDFGVLVPNRDQLRGRYRPPPE